MERQQKFERYYDVFFSKLTIEFLINFQHHSDIKTVEYESSIFKGCS